jgi:hypothetical protein
MPETRERQESNGDQSKAPLKKKRARPKECMECFPEDHQLLTNHGFMFLDEVLGEGLDGVDGSVWRGVTRDANGVVVDWHGLEVATYNKKTMCLEYRAPNKLIVNEANASGVELIEVGRDAWPATDGYGVLLDKTHTASFCGVSVVCTPNHELFARAHATVPSTKSLIDARDPTSFSKITAARLLQRTTEDELFAFRLMACSPYGVGISAPNAYRDLARVLRVPPYAFDVSDCVCFDCRKLTCV